jgi:hypothetical protein
MQPRYLPSSHLVYVTKGILVAVPFDLNRLEVYGKPTMLEEVSSNQAIGFAQIGFSQTGTVAYRNFRAEALMSIQWLDQAGYNEPLPVEPAAYSSVRLSPAGDRLAFIIDHGTSLDLWI